MSKYYVHYHLRLTKEDAEKLDRAVKSSGLSRAAYMRALINDLVPLDKPQPDFFKMMRELHAIGNNLNQIAQRAHVTGNVDAARYERNVAEHRRITLKILRLQWSTENWNRAGGSLWLLQ